MASRSEPSAAWKSRLEGLYAACRQYASKHKGRFPADLKAVYGTDSAVPRWLQPTGADQAACVFLPGPNSMMPPSFMVAYCPSPDWQATKGVNVLRLDGTVEFLKCSPSKLGELLAVQSLQERAWHVTKGKGPLTAEVAVLSFIKRKGRPGNRASSSGGGCAKRD